MAKVRAYEADLQLQRIRMANLKVMRGETDKERSLVKKMGSELEKVGGKDQEKKALEVWGLMRHMIWVGWESVLNYFVRNYSYFLV